VNSRSNADKRQAGRFEYLVDKIVTLLPITSGMAGVVKFDTASGLHRGWVDEQEIDVLPVDLVAVLNRPGNKEDVTQVHLRADDNTIAKGSRQDTVERELGSRKEVVPLAVGKVDNV
jgi:hypothetical protein